MTQHTRENRLASETSPYLLQHSKNPVEWYPWGAEALERSRREDKPIFLSIGYSACHWCHVMERESFENEATAALMNEAFVCIKVDREERPDLDEIYMKAVQAMTGQGGWPMSVWLTPEHEPFYGGTYFPPSRMYGRPSFSEILGSLSRAWNADRPGLIAAAKRMREHLQKEGTLTTGAEISAESLELSHSMLAANFDPVWGGLGGAPKFPHALDLRILLRHHLRTRDPQTLAMVTLTLDRMAEGGVYDQLGGGFHRYSTDEQWLIPHFEKMLYDNALLVPAYLEAFLLTGDVDHARVARECCDWALREMTTREGAFASAQDADSEGEEGRFFAWTPAQIETVLGEKLGRMACAWYGVTSEGNFEHGSSAMWRHESAQKVAAQLGLKLDVLETAMADARARLLEARENRVHPNTDDKVLVAWNGLMVSALAQTTQVLGDERYLAAARRCVDYIWSHMRQRDGALFATARNGRAHLNAYLDDYAFLVQGLLDLYETDFDQRWIQCALDLTKIVSQRFEDEENGGFFTTSNDHERLIARLKSPQDGALPAGNGVHALNLLRLAELTGRRDLALQAERTIKSMGQLVNRYPVAFSQLLCAVDFLSCGPREIVIAGEAGEEPVRAMLKTVRAKFLPQKVVALAGADSDVRLMPLLEGRKASRGEARAFICRNYTCGAPVTTAEALARELQ